ncbi:uncharacterized protein BKA78DRAFT_138506 [Phyllosticta capitalensis]|uniref:Uncharacterized protein n=1 Tax=Phyllosticta capitalensis TaxID=121624 RepID=A0ABR1YQC5_9PEZI
MGYPISCHADFLTLFHPWHSPPSVQRRASHQLFKPHQSSGLFVMRVMMPTRYSPPSLPLGPSGTFLLSWMALIRFLLSIGHDYALNSLSRSLPLLIFCVTGGGWFSGTFSSALDADGLCFFLDNLKRSPRLYQSGTCGKEFARLTWVQPTLDCGQRILSSQFFGQFCWYSNVAKHDD